MPSTVTSSYLNLRTIDPAEWAAICERWGLAPADIAGEPFAPGAPAST